MTAEQQAKVQVAAEAIEEVKQEIYFAWLKAKETGDESAEDLGDDFDAMDRALDELDTVILAPVEA